MKHPVIQYSRTVLVAVAVGGVVWLSAGELNPPPGAIAATDRTTINGQGLTLPYTITESGSYVLTSNLVAPADYTGNAIEILASNVTLDLNGFSIIGPGGAASSSVAAAEPSSDRLAAAESPSTRVDPLEPASNQVVAGGLPAENGILVGIEGDPFGEPGIPVEHVTIRNGTLRDWGQNGVNAWIGGDGQNVRVEQVSVHNSGINGISIRSGTVTNCIATDSGCCGGIIVEVGGVVSNCLATGNGNGITCNGGCLIIGNTAINNTFDNISASASTVINNYAP